ncbi:MAG: DUF488 domain-containing protein [Ilumatobacteraceae bacterium]
MTGHCAPAAPVVPRGSVDVGRVYDHDRTSAHRVLVDRLWPRGLAKAAAPIDEWLQDVAPTTALRRWYAHDPARFEEFARRYRAELAGPAAAAVEHLTALAASGPLRLMTATRDVDHSAAHVLRDHLATVALRERRAHRASARGARTR